MGDDEPKIFVIHENDEWVVPLRAAFAQLNLPFVEWYCPLFFAPKPRGILGMEGNLRLRKLPQKGIIYVQRMSASSHTRGHRYAAEHTHAVLEWLELYGRKVFNGSRALNLEISKVRQYAALQASGIRTPRTIVVSGQGQEYKDRLVEQAKNNFNGVAFITKHNRAGRGLGVQLFRTEKALRQYVESDAFEEPVDGITLLQEYIQSPRPFITRVEFIGGKFIYAVEVDTSNGFQLCPADHCQIEEVFCPVGQEQKKPVCFTVQKDFQSPLIEKYQKFLENNQVGVAGIEFIVDANGVPYTYDVNTNTNYNSDAEKKAFGGMKGMLELATFLGQELDKIKNQT